MSLRQRVVITSLFIFPLLTLAFNVVRASLGQLTFDAGIYHQALFDLAFTPEWNPMNTVRGIRIFLDHFDPILLVGSGVQWLFGPKPWVPYLIEFAFYYLGGVSVAFITRRERFSFRVFALLAWFTSEGLLSALHYPLHPTTWSMLPLLLLVDALKSQKVWQVLVLANLLCCFKEYYPFCLISLGSVLVLRASRLLGLGLILSGGIWCFFDFYLRNLWLGQTYVYASGLLRGFDQGVVQFLVGVISRFNWKGVVFSMFPILLAVAWVVRRERDRSWILFSLAFIAPVVMIQFLWGTFTLQYGAPIYATLVAIVVVAGGGWLAGSSQIERGVRIFLWCTLVYSAGDLILRTRPMFSMLKETEKRNIIQNAREWAHQEPADSKILASAGLIPPLLRPGQKIYFMGPYAKPQAAYDVLALAGCHEIYSWPLDCDGLRRVKEACAPFSKTVLIDSPILYLAKGPFPGDCWKR